MKRRLVAAVTAAIALNGCGAEEASVVKGAFEKEISSAQVEISIVSSSDQGESTVSMTGPYKSNGKGKLPSVDWKFTMAGARGPMNMQLLSGPDKAFVVYQSNTYEFSDQDLQGLRRGGQPVDLDRLMRAMQDWFPETATEQDATLAGEKVTRVSGKIDLKAALKDLKSLGDGPEQLKQLSLADLRKAGQGISDPRFTVDVAQSDGKLRRIEASTNVKNEGRSGKVTFTVQLSDVDKPVDIDAPTSGQPLSELWNAVFADAVGGPEKLEEINNTPADDLILKATVLNEFSRLEKKSEAWGKIWDDVETEADFQEAADETRLYARDIKEFHTALKDAPAHSAESQRNRTRLLKALSDFRARVLDFVAAIESGTATMERAGKRMEAAAVRYEKAVEAFDAG
jgi:hypothetical protein